MADALTLQQALPSERYTTPESFTAERERIFARQWYCAAREEDVPNPGDHKVLDVAGESVLLVRTKAGELRAHYNVCRHRGARICPAAGDRDWGVKIVGGVDGNVIRCPYHAWAYSLEGELLHAPFLQDAEGFDRASFGLHPVGVGVWGGFVFLHLDPASAGPLEEQLGLAPKRLGNYPLAALSTVKTIRYDVAANWKLILENYNECYHCGPVHPELCAIVPEFRRMGGIHLDWDAGIPHREGAWTYTWTGTTNRAPFASLSEEEKVRHKGELVYPNMMLSMSAEHGAAFLLTPLAHDRTLIDCRFLFAPDEIAKAGFDPDDAISFWDTVNRQDWGVCERVQQGMGSRRHQAGYYAPLEELSLDIRNYVGPLMDG